jgi:hypothetical protein
MKIETNALLKLFPNVEDIPACDEGMALATSFLEACGEAVLSADARETDGLRFRFTSRWNAFVRHRNGCDKCNEV